MLLGNPYCYMWTYEVSMSGYGRIASGFVSSSSLIFPCAWNISSFVSFAWFAHRLPVETTTTDQLIIYDTCALFPISVFAVFLLDLRPISSATRMLHLSTARCREPLQFCSCCDCPLTIKFAPFFKHHSFTHGHSTYHHPLHRLTRRVAILMRSSPTGCFEMPGQWGD